MIMNFSRDKCFIRFWAHYQPLALIRGMVLMRSPRADEADNVLRENHLTNWFKYFKSVFFISLNYTLQDKHLFSKNVMQQKSAWFIGHASVLNL